jgi:hypothetical protein
LRAKSVLLRDLEELRAKRHALENPVPIVEEVEPLPEPDLNGESTMADNPEQSTIKDENTQSKSPEKRISGEMGQVQPSQDPAKEDIVIDIEDSKEQQGLTPLLSNDTGSKPIGLGINTEGVENSPGPGTAEPQNSSIDSLFDIPDNDNTGGSELNFESMDFSFNDSMQDPSQTQANDFDPSTFGTTTQDFNMKDMQPDSNVANNVSNANKELDDLFNTGNTGDSMELDMLDLGMAGAEDSMFEEMIEFGDDAGISGGGEMEHGDFDNAFFGLDND